MQWVAVTSQKMYKAASTKHSSKTGLRTQSKWLSTSSMLQATEKTSAPQVVIIIHKVLLMATRFKIKWQSLRGERSISPQSK